MSVTAHALRTTSDLMLDRPEGRIAYTDAGSGPLVVMVPGLGDLKEEYRFLAPKVLAAGYRVVAMDIRGHGNSSVGWSDYSTAALGSDIVALVRYLDAGPATIIGTSMGAGAAAWAAAEAPDAISRIVLIGPFVHDVTPASWWQGQMMKAMIKVSFAGPWATMAWGAYYASLYPSAKPADFDAYKTRLLANLAEPGRMAATKAMANAPKTDVAARLAEVHAGTLVVMGGKDPDFPDPAAEAALVAKLLRGTFTIIDGAGHYPQAEMPEKTTPIVLDFLAATSAA
jgi:pimeloyl-ACP methyl ester carboxylesterase